MKIELSTGINPCPEYFGPADTILDIRTSTNFWRTSQLLEADLIMSDGEEIRKLFFLSEKEADEYDILTELTSALSDTKRIITFNGTGFDIPHLTGKYKAYRAKSPLEELLHTDLRGLLRQYSPVLPIETHKLRDYYSLVPVLPDAHTDAEQTMAIMPLLGLEKFYDEQFSVSEVIPESNYIVFLLATDLPCPVQYSDESFKIEGKGSSAKIKVRLYEGTLRLYHSDYHNYMYLPLEGHAIHKSLASYIASSRKIPAERETCFTCIPFGQKFMEDDEKVKKYLVTVLNYTIGR